MWGVPWQPKHCLWSCLVMGGRSKKRSDRAEHSRPDGRVSSSRDGLKYPEHGPLSQELSSAQGRLPCLLLFGTQASSVPLRSRLPKGQGKPRARRLLSERCAEHTQSFRARGSRPDAVGCLLMHCAIWSCSPLLCPRLISHNTLCFKSFASYVPLMMILLPALPL